MNADHYLIQYRETPTPSNENKIFQLHTHDEYELLLFLEGDSTYIIEDKSYSLEPYDIIIIRKNELHRIHHNTPAFYRRVNLFVAPTFFQENSCEKYEDFFLNTDQAINKIPSKIVRSNGLYELFLKYQKYSKEYTIERSDPVLKALIIEILYLINENSSFSAPYYENEALKPLISYLNNSFTEEISLDMLGEMFSYSKIYLCRLFRKATGLTINDYVRKKRLANVRELKAKGLSLSEAALSSGFQNYTSFYRAYQKEFGCSPREDLKEF